MLRCTCCEVHLLQPLGEEERDAITEKFAKILNTKNQNVVEEVKAYLKKLEECGFDVTSYVHALKVVAR